MSLSIPPYFWPCGPVGSAGVVVLGEAGADELGLLGADELPGVVGAAGAAEFPPPHAASAKSSVVINSRAIPFRIINIPSLSEQSQHKTIT